MIVPVCPSASMHSDCTGFCRRYKCDDSCITKVSWETVKSQGAYMLFYERPKYRAHPMTIAKEMLERVKHVSGLAVASPPKFTRKSTGGEEVGAPIG